ncbi:hypothetical protein XENOCAPTIV_026542 [Xenoophorus captivus]|uniref:Uncharacterized protein n=1 Tax=Xenoophorus captivus TaxID=1517983 RepID=A0ABV0S0P4_9TELE
MLPGDIHIHRLCQHHNCHVSINKRSCFSQKCEKMLNHFCYRNNWHHCLLSFGGKLVSSPALLHQGKPPGTACWDPVMDFNIKTPVHNFWNFQNKLHLTDFQQLRKGGSSRLPMMPLSE